MDAACFGRVDHPEEIRDYENTSKNALRYFKSREISQTLAKWPFTNIFVYHFELEDIFSLICH